MAEMFQREYRGKFNLNLIPLINVIFLLLIFFIVAGTVEEMDVFEVAVPISEKGESKFRRQSTLYINKDGKLALNSDIVQDKDIKTIISTVLIEDPDRPISIKADSQVSAEKLLWAMNIIKELGGKNIYLVTEQKANKAQGS